MKKSALFIHRFNNFVSDVYLSERRDSLTSEDNSTHDGEVSVTQVSAQDKKGMILPFQPLSMAFENINYYVDMPPVCVSTNHSTEFVICHSFDIPSFFQWNI